MGLTALKKQTNKKQQLEWIQSGSVIYFKVRIKPTSQAVINNMQLSLTEMRRNTLTEKACRAGTRCG